MKIEELTDAIGAIDCKYVEEAELWHGAKKRLLLPGMLIPLAACLSLAVYGTHGLLNRRGAAESGESAAGAESAVEQSAEENGRKAAGNAWEGAGQETDGGAVTSGGLSDVAEPAGGQKQEADDSGTQIRVNEVKTFSSTIYDIASPERVEWFRAEELAQYYGTLVVPECLPEGLVPEGADEARYAVAYDGKDTVVDDNNTLTFSDESGRRALDISVRTVEQAGEVFSFADDGLAVSRVNGREVTIGHYRGKEGDDCFLAAFEVRGVLFTVRSTNLTEAELIDILSALA